MAGDDSPTEKKEEFNFGRSTPPPTTSYVATSKQDYTEINTVAEPPKEDKDKDKDKDKEKDKEKEKDDKDEIDVLKPDSRPSQNSDDIRKREEDDPKKREKREDNDRDWNGDKDKSPKKADGSDVLDGQWLPAKDSKQQQYPDEEEDDNCTVKCLYYTMQCCECSIS